MRKNRNKNKINSTFDEEIFADNKKSRNKKNQKWHYSLLTILLLIFLAQLSFSLVMNVAKLFSLQAKNATMEHAKKIATKKNQYLREELEKYSSNSGVEALARNRLKFSKDDETLVIIKDVDDDTEQQKDN